jgi:hypothetical protein
VNQFNPFQAPGSPVGNISVNPQFHRRERFKKIFLAVLAVHVLLFLTLLIQGCRNDQHGTTSAPSPSAVAPHL